MERTPLLAVRNVSGQPCGRASDPCAVTLLRGMMVGLRVWRAQRRAASLSSCSRLVHAMRKLSLCVRAMQPRVAVQRHTMDRTQRPQGRTASTCTLDEMS